MGRKKDKVKSKVIDKKQLFIDRYEKIYGKDWFKSLSKSVENDKPYEKLYEKYEISELFKDSTSKGYFSFRINTKNITRHDFILILDENKITYEELGEHERHEKYSYNILLIANEFKSKISHFINKDNNLGFILNISSFFPPLLINPQDDECIIDLCAAPGIKSSQIFLNFIDKQNQSKGQAVSSMKLISIEKDYKRYTKMTQLFSQLFTNNIEEDQIDKESAVKEGDKVNETIETINIDSRRFKQDKMYDKILCDVPCSAEGEMIQNNNFRLWSSRLINSYTNTQKGLLAKAISLLKPNGIVVYSTCTLAPEENEEVINWALKRFDVSPVEIQLPKFKELNYINGIPSWGIKTYDKRISHSIRIIPNNIYEGFFICILQKN